MIIHAKFPDTCANTKGLVSSKDVETHRWIVHILAEMIEYSEKNKLHDVADSLITAIEKISPSLIGVKNTCEPLLIGDRACSEQGVENVIRFQKG